MADVLSGKGFCGWLVRAPLRDPTVAWPATPRIPVDMRLGHLVPGTPINDGFLLVAILAALVVFLDRRSSVGYELRLRGLNERFARYGGVNLNRQTVWLMFVSGALAGLIGAIMVLGSQFRFTDGALTAPQYSWSGMLAALLAGASRWAPSSRPSCSPLCRPAASPWNGRCRFPGY